MTSGAFTFKKPGKGEDPFGTLSISLDKPAYSNVLLINAQSGNTRFTISGLQATTVVPIPAAAWLLGSAMLVLGGISRARKKHPAIMSFGRI